MRNANGTFVATVNVLANAREYHAWNNAIKRCYNKSNSCYERYGGRGIVMCDKWRNSFLSFLADMGKCPDGMQLDRLDNDKNYEPGNCEWRTRVQQCNNRSSNKMVRLHDGRIDTFANACREFGLNYKAVWQTIKRYGRDIPQFKFL